MNRSRRILFSVVGVGLLAVAGAGAEERNEHRPVYSPDGTRVVFMSSSEETGGDWELYVVDSDGRRPRRLTTHSGWDGYAVWAPDGASILFDRSLTGGLEDKVPFLLELGSGEERRLGSWEGWLSVSDWSAAGRLLAFWERDGQRDLYLLTPDGAIARRLTDTTDVSEHDAHFSSDGWRIAFASGPAAGGGDGRTAIEVIDLATGDRKTLRTSPGRLYGVAWSPDGAKIAFTDAPEGGDDDADIFVLELDGGAITRLTDDPAWDHMPAWAPDGRTLLFTSYRSGAERIYALDLESGSIRPFVASEPIG